MDIVLGDLVKETLRRFDIRITRHGRYQELEQDSRASRYIALFMELPRRQKAQLLNTWRRSNSQLGQDMFVLSELDFKTNGYFVEFGAADGIDLSNTYLLEKDFGWDGIIVEPARRWHQKLAKNRSCHIDTNCVWRESDATLDFNENHFAELSTIDSHSPSHNSEQGRKEGKKYSVRTISLDDLLGTYNAPTQIDCLSIDTEGSEFEILEKFDFNKYHFSVITCEHNFSPRRKTIFSLLTKNGYVRKYDEVSYFDDWYVKAR